MQLKINGSDIAVFPSEFTVTVLDLDDANKTTRASNATLTRARIAVKRQIEMKWNALQWDQASAILKALRSVYVDITYPDPQSGKYETRTMYVGDRPATAAIEKNGIIWWTGLKFTLTER